MQWQSLLANWAKLANPSLHNLHPSLPAWLSMIHNYLDVSIEYVVFQEYKYNHWGVTSNGTQYHCMFAFSCWLGTRSQRLLSMEKTACTSPMITMKNPYYKISNLAKIMLTTLHIQHVQPLCVSKVSAFILNFTG